MLFALHLFEVPAQSVVHGEFARELPGVQRVKAALHAVKPLNVIVPDACAIQLAKNEAGEPVAEAGSIKVLALGGRQRVSLATETVSSGRQVVVSAKQLMTEIAAKFESMAAVDPDRGFSVVPVVVNERSVVYSHLRNALTVDGESVKDREGVRGAAWHICRRVQPKGRRLEVLHRRILQGGVAREVESGVKHKIRRGRIVRIEIQLRGGGCVPAGRAAMPLMPSAALSLFAILGNVITREVPLLDRSSDRS